MTLGQALTNGRVTNLDWLRLVLAASVIVSHAWPLALGAGAAEPLKTLTGHSLGGWAVVLFFFLSGLLVTASAERRSAWSFWRARARRILPGLGAALFVTIALAMATGATPGAGEAGLWFLRAMTLVSIEHRLSGAFADNPYPLVVNGPLWSLFHEVAAYAICVLFVHKWGTQPGKPVLVLAILAGAISTADGALPGRMATFAPLFLAFALGMVAHAFRDRLVLHPLAAVTVLPIAIVAPWPVAAAIASYAALSLALAAPALRLGGDFSYGMYIYGWPVAQTIVHLLPGIGPSALAALSLAMTVPFAVASWYLVERPSLSGRRRAEA